MMGGLFFFVARFLLLKNVIAAIYQSFFFHLIDHHGTRPRRKSLSLVFNQMPLKYSHVAALENL